MTNFYRYYDIVTNWDSEHQDFIITASVSRSDGVYEVGLAFCNGKDSKRFRKTTGRRIADGRREASKGLTILAEEVEAERSIGGAIMKKLGQFSERPHWLPTKVYKHLTLRLAASY